MSSLSTHSGNHAMPQTPNHLANNTQATSPAHPPSHLLAVGADLHARGCSSELHTTMLQTPRQPALHTRLPTCRPSGLISMHVGAALSPSRKRTQPPVPTSHSRTLRSLEAVAT
eukprot:1161545-Pelagomonas_calceolata.AAC.14